MSGLCFDANHTITALAGVSVTRERFTVVWDVLRERHRQDDKWG